MLFTIAELVNINVAANLLRRVAEKCKLRAHEEATPVKAHAVVVRSDIRPLCAIKAVEEIGSIASASLAWSEVGIDAKPDFGLFQRDGFDDLLFGFLNGFFTIKAPVSLLKAANPAQSPSFMWLRSMLM